MSGKTEKTGEKQGSLNKKKKTFFLTSFWSFLRSNEEVGDVDERETFLKKPQIFGFWL